MEIEPSSFRDPSGFIYFHNGTLYRQINLSYKDHYDQLIASGLYDSLVESDLLIPHQEVSLDSQATDQAYKTIKPEPIPYISYPYEWSFSQLKDAALTTLRIQKKALEHNLSLKDCSAYNIQFYNGRPVFIDTLSFENYVEGRPWVAYRQFCQHFLAPLALMAYVDVRLSQLLRVYLDGPPLDLVSSLLPLRTRLRFSLLAHIHLHAKAQSRYADKAVKKEGRPVSRMAFIALIDSLERGVRRLQWQPEGTEWGDYYDDTNYSSEGVRHKLQLVTDFLAKVDPSVVWDLGANTGVFSRLASQTKVPTLAFDIDPASVEKNYRQSVRDGETYILPLVLDLTNPSPGLGWHNRERRSFMARGPADTALALALIHHLAISNNAPFDRIVELFAGICRSLIIEFVPKSDSQVQRLLATREDVFPDYCQAAFEEEFKKRFSIDQAVRIRESERTLYLMTNKTPC